MALECLLKVAFEPDTFSDIWALGVTIWEVLTLGQEPYIDGPISRNDMLARLKKKLFLSPPPARGCSDEV